MMKDLVIAPKGVQSPKDRRDVRRAVEHWLRNAPREDQVPLLAGFDFATTRGEWSQRFLICTDQDVENAAFVAYGTKLAALLDLPATVTAIVPLAQQIPERYRPLFAEGCSNALSKQMPARFGGSFEHYFTAELFRAVFLPIRLHANWSKWLVFGSFNCRTVLSTDNKGL